MRVTSLHDCVFMNEKNPRVSNRGERGWRRRPTPQPGSGPAGAAQPPGERRPERPLRSRLAFAPRGAAGRRGRWGPAPAGGLSAAAEGGDRDRDYGWGERDGGPAGPPRSGPSVLPFQFPATALEGSAAAPSAPAADPRPGLHQLPAGPAPPFPPPPSSPSFLSGRSRPRPGPPPPSEGSPTETGVPRGGERLLGCGLESRTPPHSPNPGRGGPGHRRGAGNSSVTFTPGLLNHGAATSPACAS